MPINLSPPKRCLIAQAANWFVNRIDPIPDQDYLAAPLDVSHENQKLRDLYLTLRANDCDLRGRLMVEFSGHANYPQMPSVRIPIHVPPKKISNAKYINIADYDFKEFDFGNSIIKSSYFKSSADEMDKYEDLFKKFRITMDSSDNIFFEHVTIDFDGLVSAIQPKRTSSDGEKKCERWLVKLMRVQGPEHLKKKYFELAETKYAVSRRGFDRAWGNALSKSGNADWSKPGRKS